MKIKAAAFILVALLAAIYLVHHFNLTHLRRNQMRNMAEMRAIGTAIENYAVDHNAYPPSDSTVSALKKYLEPMYFKKIPRKGHLGEPFSLRSFRRFAVLHHYQL